jgi:branched-chain amino acid transport system permease protein
VTKGERWTVLAIAAIIFAFPTIVGHSLYLLDIGVLILIWTMAASAWNLIGGYQNQFALGHSVFFAFGAYSSTLLFINAGISPWLGMWVGVALGLVTSAFIAALCLRLKGAFYALATFALSQVVLIVLNAWTPITNGAEGVAIPFKPDIANLIFATSDMYVYVYGAVVVLFIALTFWLEKTRWGLASSALSADDEAAAALGVRILRVKVLGAAVSGGLTAIAGTAYAQYLLFIHPTSVAGVQYSIQVCLIAVFGGVATAYGPLVGAALLIPISSLLSATLGSGEAAQSAPGLTLVVYGTILVVVLLKLPEGIGPRTYALFKRLRSARPPRSVSAATGGDTGG